MPNDPGLAGDTCMFMEAVTGDGGVHNAAGVWWLSPDIQLTGPLSGPDKADPGLVNPVRVKFHRKAAGSDCHFPGDESLIVELWVANPSLAMAPNVATSSTRVELIGSIVPLEGGTGTQQIDWTPPLSLPAGNPQSPGHKCLIARCYPSSLTASNTAFFSPDDQHVAQHNFCIVPCGGPGALRIGGGCGVKVTTVNPSRAKRVTLRAVLDLRPGTFVKKTVLKRAQLVPGFQKLATKPPRRFGFDVPRVQGVEVTDHSRPGSVREPPPSFTAVVPLVRGTLLTFKFVADLQGSPVGEAHIFHLTQTGATNQAQGGLTVVMLRV